VILKPILSYFRFYVMQRGSNILGKFLLFVRHSSFNPIFFLFFKSSNGHYLRNMFASENFADGIF